MVVPVAVRAVTFAAVRGLVIPFALAAVRVVGLGVVLRLRQSGRDVVRVARRRAVPMGVLVPRRIRRHEILGVLRMLGVLGMWGMLRVLGVLGVLRVVRVRGLLRIP